MSKPANKTVIGIFVVVAIGLVVAAILILGSGKFFQDRPKYVMYFDGSVDGLAVGSPVVFRGVRVGSVTEIGMRFNRKDLSILIPVYVELGEANVEMVNGGPASAAPRNRKKLIYEYTDALIKRGIRARLETKSIVTGQLEIALDFYPDKQARLIGGPSKYPEIPTIPTQLQELTKRLEKLPIEEIVVKLQSTLDGIDKTVNSPEMNRMVKSFGQALDETRTLLNNVDHRIGPLMASIEKTSDQAGTMLEKTRAVAQNMENMTREDSPVVYRLNKTLDELERASRSLRFLAETLEQQPESLIFGKKKTKGETK